MASASEGSPCPLQDASSMQAPKFGMLIPNRVFVGGIASNTSETELKQFFAAFGPVKDCKIIVDRAGVSKGYGFVTFEQLEDAEKLMKREGEHILFKDRKLNIGPAIRKQQALPRVLESAAVPTAVGGATILYAGGVPYTFQNGLAMFQSVPSAAAVPESYTLATLPQMAVASPPTAAYPQVLMSPQQAAYLTPQGALSPGSAPPSYYQTQGVPGWAAAAAASGPQWPIYAPGLLAGANGTAPSWPVAAGASSLQLATAAGAPGQFYCSLPAEALLHGGAHHELMYTPAGTTSYQALELTENSLIAAAHSNEAGILLDANNSSAAGATVMSQGSGSVQYIDVQYGAAAPSANPIASDMSAPQRSGSAQNYGIKRVLAVPRQVICTPPTSYGVYGSAGAVVPPPVKIVAGLGGQRMVTKTVQQTEVQIIPKTQN